MNGSNAAIAVHSSKLLWYLTRGSGLVATVLLTASVVLGIVTTMRVSAPQWPRFLIAAVHRNVSLFVLVVLAFHIAVAVLDSYAPLAWVDAVVPLHSGYRPVWVGLGALALDLLLAVLVTSLLRTRLGYRRWRAVHWAAYGSWAAAIVHGLGTGSDTKTQWVLVLTAGCVLAVLAALGWRLAAGWPEHRQLRVSAAAVAALSVTLLTGWVQAGPLRPGWARTAGTPRVLLGAGASARTPAAASGSPSAVTLTRPFSGTLHGTLRQSPVDAGGLVHVTLALTVTGGVPGRLTVVIIGQPVSGGGVAEQSSQVTFVPTGSSTPLTGALTRLDGTQLAARLSGGGSTVEVQLSIAIDASSGGVSGQLNGSPA